jgi:hypothetical protein
MAELVDALVSGTSVGNNVQVRVLFWAQKPRKSRDRGVPGFLSICPEVQRDKSSVGSLSRYFSAKVSALPENGCVLPVIALCKSGRQFKFGVKIFQVIP